MNSAKDMDEGFSSCPWDPGNAALGGDSHMDKGTGDFDSDEITRPFGPVIPAS